MQKVKGLTLARRWMVGIVCTLLLGWLSSTTPVHATVVPVLRSHVNDDAQVLGSRAADIEAKLAAHERQSGDQVVVLTIPDLGGQDVESYANDVFTQWHLGQKGVDNGALIVVAVKDRRARIEVGYGLEGRLTDLASSQILRNTMQPRFAAGDYAGGVAAGVDGVLSVLGGGATISPPTHDETPGEVMARLGFWKSGAGFFVVLAVLFCALFGWMASKGGSWWMLLLLGPLTLFLLRLVWSWPVVAVAYAVYLTVAIWLRRRQMRLEFKQGQRKRGAKSSVQTWPPTWWQVLVWYGPIKGGLVGDGGHSGGSSSGGSSGSSDSSSGFSGGGGSSGGGGASGSW
jgi:uncharacterized protein